MSKSDFEKAIEKSIEERIMQESNVLLEKENPTVGDLVSCLSQLKRHPSVIFQLDEDFQRRIVDSGSMALDNKVTVRGDEIRSVNEENNVVTTPVIIVTLS